MQILKSISFSQIITIPSKEHTRHAVKLTVSHQVPIEMLYIALLATSQRYNIKGVFYKNDARDRLVFQSFLRFGAQFLWEFELAPSRPQNLPEFFPIVGVI